VKSQTGFVGAVDDTTGSVVAMSVPTAGGDTMSHRLRIDGLPFGEEIDFLTPPLDYFRGEISEIMISERRPVSPSAP